MKGQLHQLTESELLPGERILWLRETTPTPWQQLRATLPEIAAETACVFTAAVILLFIQLHLAPVLTAGTVSVLALLIGLGCILKLRRLSRHRFRQWELITNRRLLFCSVERMVLTLRSAPIRSIRLIPENRQTDGSADLRISGPRKLLSHLRTKVLIKVAAADEVTESLCTDIADPLPLPPALGHGHPLLPEGEPLLAEETVTVQEKPTIQFWYGLGAMLFYLGAVAIVSLLYPPAETSITAWLCWGGLALPCAVISIIQLRSQFSTKIPIKEQFVIGQHFLYADRHDPRPVSSCYPVYKTVYADGSGELFFAHPGKSHRHNNPIWGTPRSNQHRRLEHILHALSERL